MFTEAPFISLLIFGLPFGVISIVFYFICCMDTGDNSNYEEDPNETDVDEENEGEEAEGEDNEENDSKITPQSKKIKSL